MRNISILIGSSILAVAVSAPMAQAENWKKAGTNSQLGDDFATCVDMDSTKTSADGWTSYRWKLCSEPREIFEAAVQCSSDFSADKVTMRSRAVVANGKPKPDQPWKTESIYVSSMSGQQARLLCHK